MIGYWLYKEFELVYYELKPPPVKHSVSPFQTMSFLREAFRNMVLDTTQTKNLILNGMA